MKNNKPKLLIDYCDHKSALFACENWHYSKKMPVNKTVKIGAWENDKFIGCVIFSPGATPTLYKTYNIPQTMGCELTRVALKNHLTPVSKILSLALKFLRKSNPGIELVISFADTSKGHTGVIYQANNWIYVGEAGPKKIPFYKGKWIHARTLSVLVKSGKLKRSDCQWVKAKPKHKYLYPLTKKMHDQILQLSKPYPKRVTNIENDVPGFQSGEGGVIPTVALQKNKSQVT